MSQDYYDSRERRSGPRASSGSGRRETGGERPENAPRRRRKKRRSAGGTALLVLLYVAAVIGLSVVLACVGWVAAGDVLALNKAEKVVSFTVKPEDDFDSVTERLEEEGLIEYKFLFKLFATITHKKDSLSVGTYTLTTDMDYRALLAGMRANSANRAQVTVVIPEGYTVDQIFDLLVEKGVAKSLEELQDAAANHDYAFSFLEDIPLGDYHRLEGYLMPATYDFYTPHDPIYALNKLLLYFDSQVSDNIREQAEATGYSLREILTIASMIEREATNEDRTDISSVIYNRLNNPNAGTQGYLQIDATLVYINGGREPTGEDRNIDSPYNTYLYKGLPPGPIANPGMESIVAAMNPSSSKYYYYALGDDNIHHFFQTYDQLQRFIASQERYK